MSIFLWVLLGILYLVLFVTLGLATLHKGHTVLFFVGIFIPLLWIVGAFLPPTNAAAAASARANLR